MTDQPRDLAAEVEEIRRQASMHIMSGFSVPTLLEHIAALTRELEDLRRPLAELKKEAESEEGMEPQRMMQYLCRRVDALQKTTRRLQPDNERLRAENERLTDELAALRRPVEQSREIEAIRKTYKLGPATHTEIERLLSALDQAQREIVETEGHLADSRTESECLTKELSRLHEEHREVTAERDLYRDNSVFLQGQVEVHRQSSKREMHLAHEAAKESERLRAEIARLSSPPPERAEIVERRKAGYSSASVHLLEMYNLALADIDTLLGDGAAWRNAHALVTAERDEARGKVERLEADLEHFQNQCKSAGEGSLLFQKLLDEERQRSNAAYKDWQQTHAQLVSELDWAKEKWTEARVEADQRADQMEQIEEAIAKSEAASKSIAEGLCDRLLKIDDIVYSDAPADDKVQQIAEWSAGFYKLPPDPNQELAALAAADGQQQRDIVAVDHEGKPVHALSGTGDGVEGE